MISQPDNRFSDALRENLSRLSRYVVSTSHGQGTEMGEAVLDTLININLQISEGLLEGAERAETED